MVARPKSSAPKSKPTAARSRKRRNARENFSLVEVAQMLRLTLDRVQSLVKHRLLDSYRLSGFTEPRVTKLDLQFFAIVFGFSVTF